jgi:histidinol-phosphate aminotransferase
MISLGANENPLGMPESARLAVDAVLSESGRYPDANGIALKAALAAHLSVPATWLTLGSGSSELLDLAAQVCVEPGQAVIYSQFGFIVYRQATAHAHARGVMVPARDFGHDLDAMLAAIDGNTRLVFVANPNNPTGTFIEAARLQAFIERVPSQVTVLLDEAYTEYLSPAQSYDSMDWVRRFPNLIVTRTFSKAYGLAGLRVGYAVAQPRLTTLLNARRPRFNVTAPGLAAAQAALGDEAWLAQTYAVNTEGRAQLASGLAAMGLRCVPSSGNFVMVHLGDAHAAHARLLARGIEVSLLDNYGLAEWLRISVGLMQQNRHVLDILREGLPG